jgi:hypothetical protein
MKIKCFSLANLMYNNFEKWNHPASIETTSQFIWKSKMFA